MQRQIFQSQTTANKGAQDIFLSFQKQTNKQSKFESHEACAIFYLDFKPQMFYAYNSTGVCPL